MRVDLHVHTYPASSCSSIAYRDFIAYCRKQRLGADRPHQPRRRRATTAASKARSPRSARVLVHGVEISTLCGDFIVYSPDLDYLAGFKRRAGPCRQAGTHRRRRRRRLGAPGRRRRAQRLALLRRPGRRSSPRSSTPSRCGTATGPSAATSTTAERMCRHAWACRRPPAATPTASSGSASAPPRSRARCARPPTSSPPSRRGAVSARGAAGRRPRCRPPVRPVQTLADGRT